MASCKESAQPVEHTQHELTLEETNTYEREHIEESSFKFDAFSFNHEERPTFSSIFPSYSFLLHLLFLLYPLERRQFPPSQWLIILFLSRMSPQNLVVHKNLLLKV